LIEGHLIALNPRILVVGCGYLGMHIAKQSLARNASAFALTRTSSKAANLVENRVQPIVHNWYEAQGWPSLPEVEAIFVCASHAAVDGMVPEETHVRGLENLWQQLALPPNRLVYLSTTGVYAHCDDGQWIDESSPVAPNRPGSIAALAAEQWLTRTLPKERLTILRAAGIYGPERVPRIDSLRKNQPLNADPSSYLNLIHVVDLAAIAIQAAQQPDAYGLFNVSDGSPTLRCEYYQFIADTLGTPKPLFQSNDSDKNLTFRRRGEGSKRIKNQRVTELLNYRFEFPDYRAGLHPLLTNT
jgi:nucleoside-diphosphate-sugar epimerase